MSSSFDTRPLVLVFVALAWTSAASAADAAWSVGTGIAGPSSSAVVRSNPAASWEQGSLAQAYARYGILSGGPITGGDALWAQPTSMISLGAGGEYSLGTGNPEAHAALAFKLGGAFSVGGSVTSRITASKTRTSGGLHSYLGLGRRLAAAFRVAGLGEGKEGMDLVAGVTLREFPVSRMRLEADVAYFPGIGGVSFRPAAAISIPWGFALATTVDVPLRQLSSFATILALGWETRRFGIQLSASTSFEGDASLTYRL